MKCESCDNSFLKSEIKSQKIKMLGYEVECPNCGVTLVPEAKSLFLKYASMLLILAGMTVILDIFKTENIVVYSLAGLSILTGSVLSIVSLKTSKQTVKT